LIDAIAFSLLCHTDEEREMLMVRLKAYSPIAGKRSRAIYYSHKDNSIFIRTSLPALIHGTNEKTLSYEDLATSLNKLEEILGVSLVDARLCGIEVGVSFDVEQPPAAYMHLWGTLSRAQKDTFSSGQTVQFRNKSWSFSGYDKVAELKHQYGINLRGKRILRLEYRIKRGVSKRFGRQLTPWDLLDQAIYSRLIGWWKQKYYQIPKYDLVHEFSLPRTPKTFVLRLAGIGMSAVGSDIVEAHIKEALMQGLIGATTASRMRGFALTLTTNEADGKGSPLTDEIDQKIDQLVQLELALFQVGVGRHE
jgi:hypothetical protein